MIRLAIVALLLGMLAVASRAAVTVTINGKAVTLSTVEANGKAYVDVVALMKAVGGSATYNAKTHKVAITAPVGSTAAATGTAQLAGDNGEFGKLYTMRKNQPLYFTLLRAEYTTDQVVIGDRLYTPEASEKLLVLHFTIQNPNKQDTLARSDSLRMMAVDAKDINHNAGDWGDEETRQSLAIMLKPAQKIAAYTVITVPASGVAPKLMVQPQGTDNGPVLRYDLRGKVTALKPPIADPADAAGATALETVPAAMQTVYPLKNFDVAVTKTEFTTGALDRPAPKAGDRYFVITLNTKNESPTPSLLRHDTFQVIVTSTDGEEFRCREMLFATSDRPLAQLSKPGQDMTARVYVLIPKGVTPKTLSLVEAKSRMYLYTLQE